jgi:hypothetical protein
MAVSLFALQWTGIAFGVVIAALLLGFWLVPYLMKEIGEGKKERGPLRHASTDGRTAWSPSTPAGASDVTPGTVRNPAPGQPDAQADPYSPAAQRNSPPVHT